MSGSAAKRRQRAGWRRTNLRTSLLLVFPLWLVYQIAVVTLPGVGNGADLLTGHLIALAGHSRAHYLALQGALLAGFVILVLALRAQQAFELRRVGPVVLESALYAATMGTLILWGMRLLHIPPSLAVARLGGTSGLLARIALSLGAGVHEELLFRLLLVGGLVALLTRLLGARRWLAIAAAFLISSALFSAAHHLIGGEPWRLGVFVYRLLCGLVFATLFQLRGFAVAVYTHALYDIYVMVLR